MADDARLARFVYNESVFNISDERLSGMLSTARIEAEKEQELRRISHEKLQASIDVEMLDRITSAIDNGKEKLTRHDEVLGELASRGYNV